MSPTVAGPDHGPRTLEHRSGADRGFWLSHLLEPALLLSRCCTSGVRRIDSAWRPGDGSPLGSFTRLTGYCVRQLTAARGGRSLAKDDVHVVFVVLGLIKRRDPLLQLKNFLAYFTKPSHPGVQVSGGMTT